MSNYEILKWLHEQLSKAETALAARVEAQKVWLSGSQKSWQDVGCNASKAGRKELSAKEGRIAIKCRHDVQMLWEIINKLSLLLPLSLCLLSGCTIRGEGFPRFLRKGEAWGWHGPKANPEPVKAKSPAVNLTPQAFAARVPTHPPPAITNVIISWNLSTNWLSDTAIDQSALLTNLVTGLMVSPDMKSWTALPAMPYAASNGVVRSVNGREYYRAFYKPLKP